MDNSSPLTGTEVAYFDSTVHNTYSTFIGAVANMSLHCIKVDYQSLKSVKNQCCNQFIKKEEERNSNGNNSHAINSMRNTS
jgi:hypothetical protein